jgi:hypothetical protein
MSADRAPACDLAYNLHLWPGRTCSRDGGSHTCGECIHDIDVPALGFRALTTENGMSELKAPQVMVGVAEVQERLPKYWTDESYPDSFNKEPLPHRHYNHSLTHAMKALGGLAALSDAMDHKRMINRGNSDPEAEQYVANAGKWLADLVICASRMAQQLDIDLDQNVQHRINTLIERWDGK